MINVEVVSESNLWNKKIKKKSVFFNSLVRFFPKKYRFIKKKVSLTILLSNNQNIKKLNKKFRNKNKPTDVLSFPFEKKINIKKISYLGDIVISYEFMEKPKVLNSLEFKYKVIKIFIHGFLHLLGYDHIKHKDFKKMALEEEKIYKLVKLNILKLV
ncbi:rRNA maturation RNase YbeY [Candidatus Pelagibacter sp.]|jgi:probable rRNA maturation factor|nr:rRNA maturation RNase YbeY [Candidatus Pelagibacter sp.]